MTFPRQEESAMVSADPMPSWVVATETDDQPTDTVGAEDAYYPAETLDPPTAEWLDQPLDPAAETPDPPAEPLDQPLDLAAETPDPPAEWLDQPLDLAAETPDPPAEWLDQPLDLAAETPDPPAEPLAPAAETPDPPADEAGMPEEVVESAGAEPVAELPLAPAPDGRWREIQALFVDDPPRSVELAADMVGRALDDFAESAREQQALLFRSWQKQESDTEDLRAALQGYRALWNNVVGCESKLDDNGHNGHGERAAHLAQPADDAALGV